MRVVGKPGKGGDPEPEKRGRKKGGGASEPGQPPERSEGA